MKRWGIAAGGLVTGLLAGVLVWGPGAEFVTALTAPSASTPGNLGIGELPATRATADTVASDAGAPPPATGEAAQRGLRESLSREIARSAALGAELEELRRQLEAAAAAAGDPDSEHGTAESVATDGEGASAEGAIDESVLLAAGFEPREVADVRQRLEEIELERLFVRDQASREGWLQTQRFWDEAVRLSRQQLELRDEYGDDAYDWILYAMGSDNRVVANGVIQDSPAFQVGLEAGDVIVAYGGQRILSSHELQRVVLEGRPGDHVALDIERNGEPMRFYFAVGPIGIRLGTIRQAPRNPR
jgi:hypothetical protein